MALSMPASVRTVSEARKPWAFATIALTLLLLAIHLPLLLGRVSPIWDAYDQFAPYAMLVGDFVRDGRLLLWNPLVFAGSPDYLEPQLGVFSPLMLLTGLLAGGSRHGFELYWLAIWWLGGAGILVLASSLRAPAWGALVAAFGWSLSGFYTGNAEHTPLIATMSSLPWVLWRVDTAITSGRWSPALQAGAIWGMFGVGGYPGLVLLNACFTGLWALGRVLFGDAERQCRSRRQRAIHTSATLLVMLVVGSAVMAPTYAGLIIEGPGYSRRGGALPRSDAVEVNALAPARLATMLDPRLALADMNDATDISMRSVYVGWLVPVLAAIAILLAPQRPLRWWLLLMGLLFLAAAMGRDLPVRGWLYDWLPPMRYFRHAALFRCYFIFALTMLALFGARELQTRIGANRRWIFGVLVGIAAADALITAHALRSIMYGTSTEAWRAIGARHVADIPEWGLRRVVDNGRNQTFISKTPALAGYSPLPGPLFTEYLADPVLSASATGVERLWFATLPARSSRSEECFKGFEERARTLGAPPLVIHSPRVMAQAFQPRRGNEAAMPCEVQMDQLPAAERIPASAVNVVSYEPTTLSLRVQVPSAGWLLVTDSWSRGWRVRVNGAAATVWGGNFIFRAVNVRAGANDIEFRYTPYAFPWLLILSWGTLAGTAALSVASVTNDSLP
jgi:hypothetical protein